MEINRMQTNRMRARLEKLNKIRTTLIKEGFTSEILEVHDGVEEILVKEVKGKLYVCNIHHTFVDWYFSERYFSDKKELVLFPMFEDHFFKSIKTEEKSFNEIEYPSLMEEEE